MNTSSPTAHWSLVTPIPTVAVTFRWDIHCGDRKSAFLQSGRGDGYRLLMHQPSDVLSSHQPRVHPIVLLEDLGQRLRATHRPTLVAPRCGPEAR